MRGCSSLFERLLEGDGYRQDWHLKTAMQASVAAHLRKMLSTRAGSVLTLPDYGLPALNDMNASLDDSLKRVQRELERTIELYEPRLSRVRITSVESTKGSTNLSFTIHGWLRIGNEDFEADFSGAIDSTGEVTL